MEVDDEAHDERWLLLFTDLRGGADAGRRGEHTGRDIRTVSTVHPTQHRCRLSLPILREHPALPPRFKGL